MVESLITNLFTANLLQNLLVKEFWKSVKIWQNYGHEFGVQFFWPTPYVYSYAYLRDHSPNITKFPLLVTCGRGSILLWRRYGMLCTFGVLDDAIFAVCTKWPETGDAKRPSHLKWLSREYVTPDWGRSLMSPIALLAFVFKKIVKLAVICIITDNFVVLFTSGVILLRLNICCRIECKRVWSCLIQFATTNGLQILPLSSFLTRRIYSRQRFKSRR